MAHSLSSKKRIRQNEKRRLLNRGRKGEVKFQLKKFTGTIKGGNLQEIETEYRTTQKKIDQLCAKGLIHKNKAARQKAQLARQINALKAQS